MNPSIFSNMAPRARIGLAAAAVAFLGITFVLLKMATAPSYATIMSGIKPGQSDKITEALAERGVAYELTDGGTALAVQSSQVGDARVALANAGVNAGAGDQPGFELLDQQKLGASDFQQRVKGVGDKKAMKLSEAGLTVNGKQMEAGAAKPAKAEKTSAKAAGKDKPAGQKAAM